jgi:hypothetical protein
MSAAKNESLFSKPEKTTEVKEIATGQPPIQQELSDKAFKHLYSWEELRNRTKDAAWLYDQAYAMLEKGEELEEVEKTIQILEKDIQKFSEFYRKRFNIKIGYLRTRLNELRTRK